SPLSSHPAHTRRDSSSLCFTDTAPSEIYTLSLHDALPISADQDRGERGVAPAHALAAARDVRGRLEVLGTEHRPQPAEPGHHVRSEEHTSELQSRGHIVCRLLLEKKKCKLND